MTIEIGDIKSGLWGLSKITNDGGFSVYALDQRLADDIQVFYPPFNRIVGQYHIDCALVRLQGNIQPTDSNTVLFPRNLENVGDVTLAELTAAQRTAISDVLTAWLPAYSFDERGITKTRISFHDHILTYTGQTTLKEIARDIFRHFGHSKQR